MQDRRNDKYNKFGIGFGQNFGLFAQCIDIQIVKKLSKMFSSNSKITLTILYNSCFQNYHKKYEVLASLSRISVCAFRISLEQTLQLTPSLFPPTPNVGDLFKITRKSTHRCASLTLTLNWTSPPHPPIVITIGESDKN